MAITAFPTAPSISDTTNFATEADAWVAHFTNTFVDELDTAIAAFNFNATNSTSATSLAIGTGTKTIVLAETSRSYVKGMSVKIANDSTNWMLGEVDSYTSGTNTLVVNSRLIMGSGTYTDWVISQAATPQDVGDHCVWLHSANGFGAVKTKHRRYTAAKTNVGTAITYADDANNGATLTINEAGDYTITVCDRNATASRDVYFGVAVNSAAGTTNIQGDGARLIYSYIKDNVIQPITFTHRFAVNDVVTIKGGTGATYMPDASGQDDSFFVIRKINNG